jgi:alginate O-acetyltransferase complex protein AlgI
MIFASEIFLFLFLPLFLAGYFATPMRHRSLAILIGSYVFYGWWRVDFLLLLIGTTIFTFAMGQQIARHRESPKARFALTIGVAGCLAVLACFKYLNFFVESFAALLAKTPEDMGWHWHIILPIGISFYVFQAISYLVDVYRGDARPANNFVDFAAFIALFPQLIAGPILRYKDMEAQFQSRSHSLDGFTAGLTRFLIGLAKKVLIADAIAPLVDAGFATDSPCLALAWAAALGFALQLYFDFSGYCDMAIGLGRMMGFRFPENFRAPYHARSITEFWHRWHISLSTWLRDYLYIPLGGNRGGGFATYRNLICVMLLGGLWHGANLTFILWGGWHGIWLAMERLAKTQSTRQNFGLGWPSTLIVVLLGWVMFRADTVHRGLAMVQAMFAGYGVGPSPAQLINTYGESLFMMAVGSVLVWGEPVFAQRGTSAAGVRSRPAPLRFAQTIWGTPTVLLASACAILKLADQSVSPFLYFQF